MVVTPVYVAHQPVSKTRSPSWQNALARATNLKANDNPAFEITKKVPTDAFKGQFIDLLS